MEQKLKPNREISITPSATARVILADNDSDTYTAGVASVTLNSASVAQGAGANWRREGKIAPPLKLKKDGSTNIQEYLVTAKDADTGALTLERVYAEATDAAAAYTLAKIKPCSRYAVNNDITGSEDMTVAEIGPTGTIGAAFTIPAGVAYKSPACNVIGLQYARVSVDGAANVVFYEEV